MERSRKYFTYYEDGELAEERWRVNCDGCFQRRICTYSLQSGEPGYPQGLYMYLCAPCRSEREKRREQERQDF